MNLLQNTSTTPIYYNYNYMDYYTFEDYDFYYHSTDLHPDHHIIELIQVMSKLLLIAGIITTIINVALSLTIISKQTRSCKIFWYIYHLHFITIVEAILIFIFQNYRLDNIKLCTFLHFMEYVLIPVNLYSIVVMDIEIIRILSQTGSLTVCSSNRFLISSNITWIISTWFAVFILLFANESNIVSECFYISEQSYKIISALSQWTPSIIMLGCLCIGCFICLRTKRNLANYENVAESRDTQIFKTELFVFFVLWNLLQIMICLISIIIQYIAPISFIIVIHTMALLIHNSLPALCLLHSCIRQVLKNTFLNVIKFILGRTIVTPSNVNDDVALSSV
ncbi:hypothetical protein ACF0H5_021168 [Mactra antiquata]